MTNEYRQAFIKELGKIAPQYGRTEIFADYVAALALELEHRTVVDPKRYEEVEKSHIEIMRRYSDADKGHFKNLSFIVNEALLARRESFLGPVLEEIGASNKANGQFLTPPPLAKLCASVNMNGFTHEPGKVELISDAACGAGVMLIAQGEAMREAGVPMKDILLEGGDIDGRACDITFIELTCLGFAGIIRHMDALSGKRYAPDRYTIGFFLHGMPLRRGGRAA